MVVKGWGDIEGIALGMGMMGNRSCCFLFVRCVVLLLLLFMQY